jgi:hypothetical protein
MISLTTGIGILSIFLINGRKLLKKFPKLEKFEYEYMEHSASGYSTQSFITKNGGAENILRIRVTKNELHITTNALMAWISEQFDLLHIIPIKSLKSVTRKEKNINIEFEKAGKIKKIVIVSRNQNELFLLLNKKMNQGRIS